MTSSEKFALKWNDHQENISSAFNTLRDDTAFTDVTLISEDGQQINAHKVILSTFSPFFMSIFKNNKHPNPLLYLKGLKAQQLHSIIDFMYVGVAEIYQENLDDFLARAEELKLKGEEIREEQSTNTMNKEPKQSRPTIDTEINHSNQGEGFETELQDDQEYKPIPSTTMMAIYREQSQVSFNGGTSEDLKVLVWSMISQTGTLLTCTVCGKTKDKSLDIKARFHMSSHVESLHVDGATYNCSRCKKTFRSKHALHNHTYRAHKRTEDSF